MQADFRIFVNNKGLSLFIVIRKKREEKKTAHRQHAVCLVPWIGLYAMECNYCITVTLSYGRNSVQMFDFIFIQFNIKIWIESRVRGQFTPFLNIKTDW